MSHFKIKICLINKTLWMNICKYPWLKWVITLWQTCKDQQKYLGYKLVRKKKSPLLVGQTGPLECVPTCPFAGLGCAR